MAPKASLSAKTAQFERFFKVPVHNGLSVYMNITRIHLLTRPRNYLIDTIIIHQ